MPAKVNESSFIFIVRVWRYGAFIQLALQRQIDVVVVVAAAAVLARVFGVGNLQFRQAILCVAFIGDNYFLRYTNSNWCGCWSTLILSVLAPYHARRWLCLCESLCREFWERILYGWCRC